MLITKDWFDAPSAIANKTTLKKLGFMPDIPFNRVIDLALGFVGLSRSNIYISPVFDLLTPVRSHAIPIRDRCASFLAIGQFELMGRRPVAAGSDAASVLRKPGIPHLKTLHPSARGLTFEDRARRIADALEMA